MHNHEKGLLISAQARRLAHDLDHFDPNRLQSVSLLDLQEVLGQNSATSSLNQDGIAQPLPGASQQGNFNSNQELVDSLESGPDLFAEVYQEGQDPRPGPSSSTD